MPGAPPPGSDSEEEPPWVLEAEAAAREKRTLAREASQLRAAKSALFLKKDECCGWKASYCSSMFNPDERVGSALMTYDSEEQIERLETLFPPQERSTHWQDLVSMLRAESADLAALQLSAQLGQVFAVVTVTDEKGDVVSNDRVRAKVTLIQEQGLPWFQNRVRVPTSPAITEETLRSAVWGQAEVLDKGPLFLAENVPFWALVGLGTYEQCVHELCTAFGSTTSTCVPGRALSIAYAASTTDPFWINPQDAYVRWLRGTRHLCLGPLLLALLLGTGPVHVHTPRDQSFFRSNFSIATIFRMAGDGSAAAERLVGEVYALEATDEEKERFSWSKVDGKLMWRPANPRVFLKTTHFTEKNSNDGVDMLTWWPLFIQHSNEATEAVLEERRAAAVGQVGTNTT